MLDNSFQVRYGKLPIATYAISEPALDTSEPFMLSHHHREFEAIIVVSGQAYITIDQMPYTVSGGDILLIPPYSIHSGTILPGEAFSHFCFCFDLSLLNETSVSHLLESGGLDVERMIHHSCSDSELLRSTAHCIFRQCEERTKGWDLIVRGQLLYLLGLLEYRGSLSSILHKNIRHDFSIRVLDILNRSYNTDISSQEVAAQMSYSQSYFCRLFRENFSVSFHQYLRQYRLCQARLLLAQNKLSVSEVSAQVGFNNLSYFDKHFHTLFGCTPKQFQKMQVRSNDFCSYYRGSPPPSRVSALLTCSYIPGNV